LKEFGALTVSALSFGKQFKANLNMQAIQRFSFFRISDGIPIRTQVVMDFNTIAPEMPRRELHG
jgi:hypothetical protein